MMGVTVKTIRFIQIEPGLIVTDPDYRTMDYVQRGLYVTLMVEIAAAGGKLRWDEDTLMSVTGYFDRERFRKALGPITKHFRIKNGFIRHPSVSAAIQRARKCMKDRSLAGQKGMASRWAGDNTDITKERKEKESEEKGSKGKLRLERALSPCGLATSRIGALSLTASAELCQVIEPRTKSDRTCFSNVARWIVLNSHDEADHIKLKALVLSLAKASLNSDNPAACFMSAIKAQLGYTRPSWPEQTKKKGQIQ